MKPKKVCVVTGSSAEFGPLKILIRKIIASEKLSLLLLVTGMHLLEKFGKTIEQIEKEEFPITKIIPMYDENDNSSTYLGKAVGKAIGEFTEVLSELKPNILVVIGDRFESLAAAIAASTLSIPIAHIQGGDSVETGQVDEQIRHALTKFSHIHFTATKQSAERVRLLGEESWRIHLVGAIAMDMIYQENFLTIDDLRKNLGLDISEKIIVCVQHPYVYEAHKAGKQMHLTLQVLKDLKLQTVIFYPNNDPGVNLIIQEIEINRKVLNFRIFKRVDRKIYLSLLKHADLLIGNSSCGLIESPAFKLPTVNIGDRNKGRQSAENVINVQHDYALIKEAILKAISADFKNLCQKVKNPYGDGVASDKIAKILESLDINEKFIRKKLTYIV